MEESEILVRQTAQPTAFERDDAVCEIPARLEHGKTGKRLADPPGRSHYRPGAGLLLRSPRLPPYPRASTQTNSQRVGSVTATISALRSTSAANLD
jgi:hypothetical protein